LTSEAVTITVTLPPQPAFLLEQVDATTIQLYNSSQYYTGHVWDFGDGVFSVEENPQHTYSQNGMYEVTLTVYNECDTLVLSQEVLIELPPTAYFSGPSEVVACSAPLITFQNESQGGTSYQWILEGGTPSSSSDLNPTVQYSNSGTYMVTLIVQNASGADTLSQTLTIDLLPFPVANYTWVDIPNSTDVQFTFTGW
jgi:PKD repeat protein